MSFSHVHTLDEETLNGDFTVLSHGHTGLQVSPKCQVCYGSVFLKMPGALVRYLRERM
jgi:hypothetical protein